jgi:hypothetical protein
MTDTNSAEQSISNLIEIARGFEKRKKYELADQVLHAVKTLMEPTLGTTHALYMDCLFHLAFCNQKLGRSGIGRDAIIHYLTIWLPTSIRTNAGYELFTFLGSLAAKCNCCRVIVGSNFNNETANERFATALIGGI